jgi:hypothetical protein
MKVSQFTTAAALFCDFAAKEAIPLEWFKRAIRLFEQYQLSPVLFTARGSGFSLDDCFVVAEPGGGLVKWEEEIAGRRELLVNGLKNNEISSLRLDTSRSDAVDRSDWQVTVSVFLIRQECFISVDEGLIPDPSTLLQQAIEMTSDLFRVRYGFAYKMPLADEPDSYAVGIQRTTLSDFRQWLKRRKDGLPPPETPDELWHEELLGQR